MTSIPASAPAQPSVPMRRKRGRPPSAGFTMMEFILVIGITGIMIVGLGALVEIPRRMAEKELSGDARLSDLDRALKWLDDDVRFAKDVAVPSEERLEITRRDGSLVTYEWTGANGPLVRTDPDDSVRMVEQVARLSFSVGLSAVKVNATDGSVSESTVETAGFDTFTLNPGYTLSALLRSVLNLVSVVVDLEVAKEGQPLGVLFTASGLEDDDGYLESIRLRLRRVGPGGVKVIVYEALSGTYGPNRSKIVTATHVVNAALPSAMSDFTIPLPSQRRIEQGKSYFVELVPVAASDVLELEVKTLSDPDAAAPSGGGLVRSTDGGRNYSPLAGSLNASQTVYAVTAQKTATETGGSGSSVAMIPTCVQLTLKISTGDGVTSIDTSFPIENNVALVNR